MDFEEAKVNVLNENNKIQYFIAAVICVAFIVAVLVIGSEMNGDSKAIRLKDGWTVDYGDKKYDDVDFDSFKLRVNCKKNDVMELSKKLDVISARPMTLIVYSRLSSVEAFVDSKKVYGSRKEEYNGNSFVGSGYHFILLPDDIQGKVVRIVFTAAEDKAFSHEPDIILCPSDDAYTTFTRDRRAGIMIAIFLMMCGLAMLFISMFGMVLDNDFYPLIMIGYFSLLAGMWCFCAMKGAELFLDNIEINSVIEYVSLYLLPLPIIRMTLMGREHLHIQARRFLWGAHNLILICLAVFLGLHMADVIHMSQTIIVLHVILVFGTPVLLFVKPGQWQRLSESEKLFQLGMWISVAVGIGDILWYYINKYVFLRVENVADLALPIGFMIMVIVFVVSYLLEIYTRRLSKNEKEYLVRMAYEDELTGLGNRLKGEETLKAAADWDEGFAIVNIDLNGLKTVNDKYGHAHGDEYISKFSHILSEVFGNEEVIARMGGDEFLVILRGDRVSRLPDELERLRAREQEESDGSVYVIEASYGVARSSELTFPNPEALFAMADQRMYQMKRLSGRARR